MTEYKNRKDIPVLRSLFVDVPLLVTALILITAAWGLDTASNKIERLAKWLYKKGHGDAGNDRFRSRGNGKRAGQLLIEIGNDGVMVNGKMLSGTGQMIFNGGKKVGRVPNWRDDKNVS